MISSSSLPLLMKVGIVTLLSAVFTINFLSSRPPSRYYDAIGHAIHGPSFLEIAQGTQIDDPYDLGPLRELCASTNWTEGVIFSCGVPTGEVAEVRNTVLNCVRYAIAAGAALVVPQIYTLVEDVKTKVFLAKIEPFTHFFDLPHFLASLSESCPQMTIYGSTNDLWAFPTVSKPVIIDPTNFFTSFKLDTLDAHPSEWRQNFYRWLAETHTDYTPTLPVFLRLREPFLNFPTDYDPPAFVRSFGRILQFRPDIRLLAAQVQLELSHSIPAIKAASKISEGTYLGGHMRRIPDDDRDATVSEWTSLATQAKLYVDTAITYNLTTIYVATARIGDISAIKSHAKKLNMQIVHKESLLPSDALDAFSWDQRAIVDFEVLLKASGFVGVTASLFAWSIAMRRHLICGQEVDTNDTTEMINQLGFGDGCTRLLERGMRLLGGGFGLESGDVGMAYNFMGIGSRMEMLCRLHRVLVWGR